MVRDCSSEPSSKASTPPNQAKMLPVRGPVPPFDPHRESHSGVPKFVELSVHVPAPMPASKLPSATKLLVHDVPSPWYVPLCPAQSTAVVVTHEPPARQHAPVGRHCWLATHGPVPKSSTSSCTTPGVVAGEKVPTVIR